MAVVGDITLKKFMDNFANNEVRPFMRDVDARLRALEPEDVGAAPSVVIDVGLEAWKKKTYKCTD